MRQDVKNLKYVFEPDSVAVIGASSKSSKLGNVVLRNFLEGAFEGPIYPINPKYKRILGLKCYPSVSRVKKGIDLAIIATPAHTVPSIVEECGKKGIKGVVVLSAGFREAGNYELEKELKKNAKKYQIALIGPNCLGVLNPHKRVDSIFFPIYKFGRPKPGSIAFVTQSGGVGSCVVDLASDFGIGFSKFVSYGNAACLDESDIMEYLSKDKETDAILLYLEGTKDGKKLLDRLKKITPKKPVIVLKAGRGKDASKAAYSHTGALAGNYLAYKAAFRQSKAIEVSDVAELFQTVNLLSQPLPKGKRVGVITDGGGLGVLTADAIEENGLELASFSKKTTSNLVGILPSYGSVGNPLDLIADADAERYKKAITALLDDSNVDSVIVVVLFQAPAVDSSLLDIIIRASDRKKKPILIVAMGGEYTTDSRKALDSYGVPTYISPSYAVEALKRVTDYSLFLKTRKR